MSSSDVSKNLIRNTISNYGRIVLRLFLGVFLFRMLFQGLSREEFGYWSFLWMIFGYGVLMDFGLGFAAQKRVAELIVTKEWDLLSRTLSTIFFFYIGIGVVIATTGTLFADHLMVFFETTQQNREAFSRILIIFLWGLGIGLPVGIFPEILRGQQRIHLANNLVSISLIFNFALIWSAIHWDWGFQNIVLIALATTIGPDFIAAIFAFKEMPEVKVKLRHFSWGLIRETSRFSLYAYIITATNIILGKTDQLVISSTLGFAAVAIYQVGAKAAEMFSMFTMQLQNALSPAAASLNAEGNKAGLTQLLINSEKVSVLIATPIYLLCAFFLEGLLRILAGSETLSSPGFHEMFWVAQLLLFWFYTTIITHSVSKRIFMMCGHEKKLMLFGVGEAVFNLVLSVSLILIFQNVISVAVGSLIPTLFFGWFFLWPWMARETERTIFRLIADTLWPAWIASVPLAIYGLACRYAPFDFGTNILLFFLEGGIGACIGIWGIWVFAMDPAMKLKIKAKIPFLKKKL